MGNLLELLPLGINGAAPAALGDIAVSFFAIVAPFVAGDAGVKLGESTFRRFLAIL